MVSLSSAATSSGASDRRSGDSWARTLPTPSADRPHRGTCARSCAARSSTRPGVLPTCCGPSADLPRALAATLIEGRENAIEATAGGRGIVLVGAHVGGWEVATALPAAVLSVPTTVIVADWLAWAIQHVRYAAGLRVAYAGRLPLDSVRLLHRGEALLVLGDDGSQTSARSYPVQFCGATAGLPAGAVSLARLAGASIVPFTVLPRGRRRWVATVEPCIEPPGRAAGTAGEQAVLQLLADRWTATVRQYPEHWAASFPIDWHDASCVAGVKLRSGSVRTRHMSG